MPPKVRLYVGGILPPCLQRRLPWWFKTYLFVAVVASAGTMGWDGRPKWLAPLLIGVAFVILLTQVVRGNIKAIRVTGPLRKGRLVCWPCGQDLGDTPSPGACPRCGEQFTAEGLWAKWATTPYVRLKPSYKADRAP